VHHCETDKKLNFTKVFNLRTSLIYMQKVLHLFPMQKTSIASNVKNPTTLRRWTVLWIEFLKATPVRSFWNQIALFVHFETKLLFSLPVADAWLRVYSLWRTRNQSDCFFSVGTN